MKVLQICSHFSIHYPGGITKYVKTLSSSLSKSGVSVSILSGELDELQDIEIFTYKPKNVKPYSLSFNQSDESLNQLFEYLKKNNFDIIHIHATGDLPLDFYQKIQLLNTKYIVSLHDYYLICPRIFMIDKFNNICHKVEIEKCKSCIGLFESNDFLFRLGRKLDFRYPTIKSNNTQKRLEIMKTFLENASLLLPVSNKVKDIFYDLCPTDNYRVLHIGNESANLDNAVQKQSDKIRLSFLGTLNIHKGEDILFNILSEIDTNRIQVNFYGRASKQTIKKFSNKKIKFKGSYTPDKLKNIMENTDLGLVLPIWEDNAPQVVMEFLNFGIPVIGTHRGGLPDFIDHKINGYLFDPEQKREIENVIQWINSIDDKKITYLKKNIKKLKTPEKHAKEIVEIYNKINGNP